jgi:epoxyqueuosine reductase
MNSPEYDRQELTRWIKSRAAELGFDACGISAAGFPEEDEKRLNDWLEAGFHGEMGYMARNKEKRLDPRLLVPGARSVISFLINYYPEKEIPQENNYKIARYAYGKDYHFVIREKLHQLAGELKLKSGNFHARVFTDSAPVLERAWAEKAGLGWIGKNTCLIHPKLGSYVFIAEIITDLELEYDRLKINDLCGGCTRCIDACPTGAIVAPRRLDARKCISYHTIESRNELPEDEKKKFGDWIFGCDVCQEVCPWNRKAGPHCESRFTPKRELMEMTREKWEALSKAEFDILFNDSAIQRTTYEGLKRNIIFLKK